MPIVVPRVRLTHGQAAWVLCNGQPPPPRIVNQLRYLRLVGIPFTEAERRKAAGCRLRYDFDHLVEARVALFGLGRGMTPKDVATFVIDNRADLRRMYRQILQDQPEKALEQPWVKSRGKHIPLLVNEMFLRLHDRYAEAPCTVETLGPQEVRRLEALFGLHERYPGEEARVLFPLTRALLELVAWTQEVPEIKPGPK